MPREKLGEILIRAGLLDETGLQRALNEQHRWGGQLGRYLVELGLITEETLVRALSTQYKLPAVSLDPPRMDIKVGRLIPKDICERNGLICFRADMKKKFLDVAMSDPSNANVLDEVRVATQFNIRPHIAAPTVIDKAISFVFYGDMSMGDEIDLSPNSSLRTDPASSELARRAAHLRFSPTLPKPSSWEPGVTPVRQNPPALDLKVTANPQASPPIGEASFTLPTPNIESALDAIFPSTKVKLPSPAVEESFHITLDVPVVDKNAIAQSRQNTEERLAKLEAMSARDCAIIQKLLEALVRRGYFTQEEILRLISEA